VTPSESEIEWIHLFLSGTVLPKKHDEDLHRELASKDARIRELEVALRRLKALYGTFRIKKYAPPEFDEVMDATEAALARSEVKP
jgi:hypothetical protein